MSTSPLRVDITATREAAARTPDPLWSPESAATLWRQALQSDPSFIIGPHPDAFSLVCVEAEDLASLPDGIVALVDWPQDTSVPEPKAITQLRGIVTQSSIGAELLGRSMPPARIVHLPVPISPSPLPTAVQRDTDRELTFTGELFDSGAPEVRTGPMRVPPESPVFTLIADADDAYLSWYDALFAFVAAFRHQAAPTLIVWVSHEDPTMGPAIIGNSLDYSTPHECRVMLAIGQMDPLQYRALRDRTDFMIANADPTGGRRPLTDFMSAGVPVIGPPAVYPDLLVGDVTCLAAASHQLLIPSWLSAERRLSRTSSAYDWDRLVATIKRAVALDKGTVADIAQRGCEAVGRVHDPRAATRGLANS